MSNTAITTTAQPIVVSELAMGEGTYGQYLLAHIRPSPDNRKRFNAIALKELAASIQAVGVAQPILIRPVKPTEEAPAIYEIVAGERRYRASIIAGLTTIPAVLRELSDLDAAKIRILENLQREDPHPIEEAEGYQLLMQQHGFDADHLAEEVKKSRSYIYGRLKLCALTEHARDAFFDNRISASTALLIARIPVKSLQEKCLKEVREAWNGPMSFRAAAQHIEHHYMLNLKKATFKPTDATLVPAAGSCTACPKRAGNQPEVFQDVNADVCTDPVCFKAKGEVHVVRIKQQAKDGGIAVLSGTDAKKVMPHSWGDLNQGYVAVDRPVYSDEKNRTMRQILGKDMPTLTLLESPHDGSLLHIVKLDQVEPLLEAKGISAPKPSPSHREREKEMEAKAKIEREYRKRLLMATHHESLMMNLVDPDLRLVAAQMFENLPWNTIPTKFLIEMYGWTEAQFDYPRRQNIRAAIDTLTPAQLNQFIRDCSLCRELEVNVYTATPKDKPENLLAFAKRTKVDAKQIRVDVEAEAKVKSEKKKGAGKKGKDAAPPALPAAPAAAVDASKVPTIDFAGMGKADLVEFITINPTRVTELARAIIERGTDDLVSAFNATVDELGYAMSNGEFIQIKGPEQESLPLEAADVQADTQSAIDVDDMQLADLVEFIRANPARLGELTEIVLSHARGELVGMLQKAATSLGYIYQAGRTWAIAGDRPAAAEHQVEREAVEAILEAIQ